MKELLKQNGVLRLGIFVLITAIPLGLVVGYLLFLSYWFISGGIRFQDFGYFLVLALIFFGVNSNDFFGPNRNGTLLPKHTIMLCSLPFAMFYGSKSDSGLFFGFLFLYSMYLNYSRNPENKGFYWQYENATANFSVEDVSEAIRKQFFLVRTEQKDQSFLIKGFGLWAFQIIAEQKDKELRIRIEPMSSGITFFLFLKVMPGAMGEFYGKQILKNLGLSLEASKVGV
ncbi:hypothetical protein [Bdellovibrio sp. HCB-110]|uniref:hypothetical protein n=1 Tax=Bdellovibrio sp. HCB-110 TaxID=3391182 RepID=UPI0039B3A5CB